MQTFIDWHFTGIGLVDRDYLEQGLANYKQNGYRPSKISFMVAFPTLKNPNGFVIYMYSMTRLIINP